MNDQMQALAFLAGANSIFYGEKLLTTDNPETNADMQLFARLGIEPEPFESAESDEAVEAAVAEKLTEAKLDKVFYDAAQ